MTCFQPFWFCIIAISQRRLDSFTSHNGARWMHQKTPTSWPATKKGDVNELEMCRCGINDNKCCEYAWIGCPKQILYIISLNFGNDVLSFLHGSVRLSMVCIESICHSKMPKM